MAPEQFEGVISEATDWYAVGALLHAALSGVTPTGDTPSALVVSRSQHRGSDPRLRIRGLPDDLVELSLSLLDPDAERRPSGAQVAYLLGVAHASARPVELSFVGRAAELEALERPLAARSDASMRTVHVHGEWGIGKSALVQRFTKSVETRGGLVFRGACYRDASVPYGGLDSLVDSIAATSVARDLLEEQYDARRSPRCSRYFALPSTSTPRACAATRARRR